jgi:Fe-S-cluster containining protein
MVSESGNGQSEGLAGGTSGDPLTVISSTARQAIERALEFSNIMSSVNQDQGKETIACVQALTEVLLQNGIVRKEELEKSLKQARERIATHPMPAVRLANIGDKYSEGQTAEIDCASLIHLCKARCCTFKFYLTKQDLDEGVARWDYGNPYWIKQGPDGFCVHSDCATRACTIHSQRPHVCRAYDCRKDKRVWIDFELRMPAPMPETSGDAPVAMAEIAMRNWSTGLEDADTSAAAGKEDLEKASAAD